MISKCAHCQTSNLPSSRSHPTLLYPLPYSLSSPFHLRLSPTPKIKLTRPPASAVSRLDNLEFVSDIVPRTVPFKAIKDKKPATTTAAANPTATNGESSSIGTASGGQQPLINGANGFGHTRGRSSIDEGDDPNAQYVFSFSAWDGGLLG
jgi:hypothetical protein